MGKENAQLVALNRGLISRLGLARVDLKRTALSAEVMTNWMPRVLGSMQLRPGMQYLGGTDDLNDAIFVPFVFAVDDRSLIEITNTVVRFWTDDEVIARGPVSTTIANGGFDTNLTSWTDNDESGATSAWVTGGYMGLTGTGYLAAKREQALTIAVGDQGAEHALRIVIERGPVTLRVGSTSGTDDLISEAELNTGTHSLVFVPSGANAYVEFSSRGKYQALVDSVAIEAAGVLELPGPWTGSQLTSIRWEQSNDVVYIACGGVLQRQIERRSGGLNSAKKSWSITLYQPDDGPWRNENTGPIRLTPSALSGSVTITASAAYFKSTNVGSLIRIQSSGQAVESTLTGDGQFTNSVKVTGVGAARALTYEVTGAGTWTIRVQQSLGEPGNWVDYSGLTFTGAAGPASFNDGLDNQIVYYRIGIKTGEYTSGTPVASLDYASGSIKGIARITAFSSATSVTALVLQDFGDTDASEVWWEGEWSDRRGYPSAVRIVEGRLGWFGKGRAWLSVSDGYDSFDDEVEGDSGPINRNIGSGAVDTANWALALERLIIGTQAAEISARSNNFAEPLAPDNFNTKPISTQGSASVPAVQVDDQGIYIQRNGVRIYALEFTGDKQDYRSQDMTRMVPDLGLSTGEISGIIGGTDGFRRIAVQRQPDTRIHCVRNDGTVAVLVMDAAEDVACWVNVVTDGIVRDVVVLPSESGREDSVYYVVRRNLDGITPNGDHFLEKWQPEASSVNSGYYKNADSFIFYVGSAATSIPVAHLDNGTTVVAWDAANNLDLGTFTVTAGAITLPTAKTNVVVGLGYTAQFKSSKLAYAAQGGSALTQVKRLNQIGLILADCHAQGLKYGPSFSKLHALPLIGPTGATLAGTEIIEAWDNPGFMFQGEWSTDSRMCLQAAAPRPVTVLAAVMSVTTNDDV